MTQDELKLKCVELSRVGDAQAFATLAVIHKYENLIYCMQKVGLAVELFEAIRAIPEVTPVAELPPSTDAINLREVEKAVVSANPVYNRVPGDCCRPPEDPAADPTSPESVAAAATRAANGLPPRADPGVFAANTEKAAGAHESGTGV